MNVNVGSEIVLVQLSELGNNVILPVYSITLNGLAASTGYDYYVRSNCGTSQSTWTAVSFFSTAKVCPQTFGFENNSELVGWSTFGNGSYGLSADAPVFGVIGSGGTSGGYFSPNGASGVGITCIQSPGLYAFKSTGKLNMATLPTSASGLSAGDIWNNAGVLNIV